jgi:hypothetical protein
MKMRNRAQAAIEFMALISIMLLVFLAYFGVMQDKAIEMSQSSDQALLQQIGDVIKSHIDNAVYVEDGFRHKFMLPTDILGKGYNVTICPGWNTYIGPQNPSNVPGKCYGGKTAVLSEITITYEGMTNEYVVKIPKNTVSADDQVFQKAIKQNKPICLTKLNSVIYINLENCI